jgi:hypothetical protein
MFVAQTETFQVRIDADLKDFFQTALSQANFQVQAPR